MTMYFSSVRAIYAIIYLSKVQLDILKVKLTLFQSTYNFFLFSYGYMTTVSLIVNL